MFANNRAVENLILGNRDDAYWWSRAAIHADPEFAGALLTLAVIYRDSHHPEFAEEVLEQAVRRYPENAAILSNWIQVFKELGREAESIALTQQLLELEAQQPWSYYLKAQAEYGVGHFSNARALLEKELVRDPGRYVLNYALALVWLQLHDSVQASIYLERAIALCPVPQLRTRYRMQLARLKSKVGRATFSNRILLSGGALVLAKPHQQ